MVSFRICQTLRTTGGVLVLAALVMPSTGFPQRASDNQHEIVQRDRLINERERQVVESIERDLTQHDLQPELDRLASDEQLEIIEKLQEEIEAVELQDGLNSPDLIGPLTALGERYREREYYVLATAAVQRAIEVLRYNHGLFSLEQAPLIRQLIANAKSIGITQTAWDLEQELLRLAERHPDDLRTARILRETADGRMDVLRRYGAGENPPEILYGCYYELPEDSFAVRIADASGKLRRDCLAGSRRKARQRLASEAQSYYAQSYNIIHRNEGYRSDELPTLLMDLVRSSYAYDNPELGSRSLRFLRAYEAANLEPWAIRIDTLVQIADWELLYSQGRNSNEEALTMYEQTYELLKEHGMAQASIEQIFSPTTPIVLPAFLPNPLASEETAEATGYIDLAFEINKYGKGRRIQVLDSTSNSTRVDERRLVELVLQSRFRPRVTNGQFADSGPIVVRYHLNE